MLWRHWAERTQEITEVSGMPDRVASPIVDAHVHLGEGHDLSLDVDSLLELMDEAGVERAVVCPVDHYLAEHNRDRVPREDQLEVGEVISAPELAELE